jgi:hypothetical protein
MGRSDLFRGLEPFLASVRGSARVRVVRRDVVGGGAEIEVRYEAADGGLVALRTTDEDGRETGFWGRG